MHFEEAGSGSLVMRSSVLICRRDVVKCVAFLFVLYLMLSFCFVVLSCELLILVD